MANRAIEPVTLPWKRPEKGVSAAELGASFRVEQREDGWHCTVKAGRRVEVLATGLRRLRDAQCRAEAHAATLPEVAAALEKQAAEANLSKSRAKQERPPERRADVSAATQDPTEVPALTYEQVSDGCICGKIEGGTWVADPNGGVSVPSGTDPVVAQQICRVATNHYTALRAKPSKSSPAKRSARASTKTTAKRDERVARPATPTPPVASKAGRGPKFTPKPFSGTDAAPGASRAALAELRKMQRGDKKAAAGKAAAVPTSKAASASKGTKAASAGKKKGKAASRKAAATPASNATSTRQQTKTSSTKKGKAGGKKAAKAKATAKPPKEPAARGRKGSKKSVEQVAATPAPPAKEEKVSKRPAKNAKPPEDASCGCVTWAAVDGKIRGTAKHGTFIVEPEGKRHALYFYDADGQSRHLESGEAGKLRKVAEEMATRGQPAPRAASSGADDAALMRAFLGDDA